MDKPRLKHQQGSTMIFVMILIALFAVMGEALFYRTLSQSDDSGKLLEKMRLSYLAEGIGQIAGQFAQDYFQDEPAPTSAGLDAYVTGKMATLDISPWEVDLLQLSMSTSGAIGAIPSGPFVGMESLQIPVELSVRLKDPVTNVRSEIKKNVVLAKITLFQFAIFSDMGGNTSYLAPGMPMAVRGRVHINGSFCLGNYGAIPTALQLEKLTVSGEVRNLREPACWVPAILVANQTEIATDQTFTAFHTLVPGGGHGCIGCEATAMDWKQFALSTWRGNLMDSSHDVRDLKLPIKGTAQTQDGIKADLALASNQGSLRLLVDPVLATDNQAIKEQKLAYKADVRIINGTWYLKNPADPNDWPGIPIWSDHPGSFTAQNEEAIEGNLNIGQEDIRTRWALTATPWIANDVPRLYSYYAYDPVAQNLFDSTNGVLSYGSLFRTPGPPPVWKPGHWARAAAPEFCTGVFVCSVGFCSDTILLNALLPTSIQCSGGAQPVRTEFLLNAARSGYRDGHVATQGLGTAAEKVNRSRLYSMNFDVDAFQTALLSVAPGELGSYFGVGSFMGRNFNGIVYLTNTWLASMGGLGGGFPSFHPDQGAQNDLNQVAVSHAAQQRALPFALCSANNVALPGGLAGVKFTPGSRFTIPDCLRYDPTYAAADRIDARPNVIRIINGSNLNMAVLNKGLTIATNLPVYLLGDYNLNSDTTSGVAVPWIPNLIASDQLILMSKNWEDTRSRWDVGISTIIRNADDTTYQTSFLTGGTGTTPLAWSGGLENLPRFIERWNVGLFTKQAKIRGSLVMGFSSVYFRHQLGPSNPVAVWQDITYLPPNRDFSYDDHLHRFVNQPPGAPGFNIYSVKFWSLN